MSGVSTVTAPKNDTAKILNQLRALVLLTQTEEQVARTRIAQARTDAVRRELNQNADHAAERTQAITDQLRTWLAEFPVELPLGVVRVFLGCWVRLYGLVAMEIFGHLKFALDDAAAFFEAELHGVAELLGIADLYAQVRKA